jgi:hypothetical protein
METVDTLDNTPLKLLAGQFGLWGLEIPGSDGWTIKEVTGAHMGDGEGVIVTIAGPNGAVGEGFAPKGRHFILAATCNALADRCYVLDDQVVDPPEYDFDALADLIEREKQ